MRQYINRQKIQKLIRQKLVENYKKQLLKENSQPVTTLFYRLFPEIVDDAQKADNTIKQSLLLEAIYELFDTEQFKEINKDLTQDVQASLLTLKNKLRNILDQEFFDKLTTYLNSNGTTTLTLEGFNNLIANVKDEISKADLNIPKIFASLLNVEDLSNTITTDHLKKIKEGIGIPIKPIFEGNGIIIPINHKSTKIEVGPSFYKQPMDLYNFPSLGVKAEIKSAIDKFLMNNKNKIQQTQIAEAQATQFDFEEKSFIDFTAANLTYENFDFE